MAITAGAGRGNRSGGADETRGREADGDDGAAIHLAIEGKHAAVHFNHRPGQRQAQTGALGGAVELAVHLAEGRKHLVNSIRWNPNAGIGNRDRQIAAVIDPGRHRDGAPVPREFHRVR